MAFLYIGTFGSFIGYSAAMPLLIKLNFWVPEPAPRRASASTSPTTRSSVPCVGSATRPLGGWLADRFGGARVTLVAFGGDDRLHAGRAVDASGSSRRTRPPTRRSPSRQPALFPLVPGLVPLIFVSTGIGNGSTYKMIPAIFRTEAERATTPGTPERDAALLAATKQASAAVGVIGAVGAHRRLPDPDHVRLAVGHRPAGRHQGRVPGLRRLLRRSARSSPARVYLAAQPRPAHEPGRRRDLMHLGDDQTHCPYCSLQCGMTLQRRAGRASRCAVGGVPGQRGRVCAARAGRPPGCAAAASG